MLSVESIGITHDPLAALVIPLAILTCGVTCKAAPVLGEHHSVIGRAVSASYLHEASGNLPGGVGKSASIVYELVAITLSELKLILGIDDNRVVGIAYLTSTSAEQEFSIPGDCEDALGFILVFLLTLLIKKGIDRD